MITFRTEVLKTKKLYNNEEKRQIYSQTFNILQIMCDKQITNEGKTNIPNKHMDMYFIILF